MLPANIKNNFEDPDEFYNHLVENHESLSDQESTEYNLTLIFLLANEVGQTQRLKELMDLALDSLPPLNTDKKWIKKSDKFLLRDLKPTKKHRPSS